MFLLPAAMNSHSLVLPDAGATEEEFAVEASPMEDASRILFCRTINEELGRIDLLDGPGRRAKYEAHPRHTLLAIAQYDENGVRAFNLTQAYGPAYDDPITLFNEIGYDALRDRIQAGFEEGAIEAALKDLTLPGERQHHRHDEHSSPPSKSNSLPRSLEVVKYAG
ncbi:MAG: hypothetical protein HYV27_05345 [Candidatus Hydrogenedentes bacterium]|nr:hypothetical protein [Candidatus Hydrogenedentota bacterium]